MSHSHHSTSSKSPSFYFKFWGVRGSIASPGPDTQKYGGNTACIEVRVQDHIFILDGGTGLRRLGCELMNSSVPKHIHIFLSHLHWDHIQGIPFFTPAFIKGNIIHFYGERKETQGLQDILEAQMHSPNFPVPLSIMQAELRFTEVQANETLEFDGGIKVSTAAMNHPNGCLGIRVSYQGKSIVYTTDTEHDPQGQLDQNILDLAAHADVLIYDSMYTEEEYRNGRIGWGHSTYTEAIRVSRAAEVKQVYFFHHDPEHDDQFLDEKIIEMKDKTKNDPFEVDMAVEGRSYSLID